MSEIKSYSVGNGDMFCINHDSDNFTIIDCCLNDDVKDAILREIKPLHDAKGIRRFISTHPDDDHLRGIDELDDHLQILNFYCVKNAATKEEMTDSFQRYCELRDSSKAFYIERGCSRKWMNLDGEGRGSSGINIAWPNTSNADYIAALEESAEGGSPNNISAVVQYKFNKGAKVLWMGDLETDFMIQVAAEIDSENVDILFAPHHGRDSGRIPEVLLDKLDPQLIVVGEAPSKHLHYYPNHNTITQNSAGDILFDCVQGKVHIFTSKVYSVDFLNTESVSRRFGYSYLGTLTTRDRG